MSLAKVEKKLKNHDGTCPVCREHTWVESERTRWLGEGEIHVEAFAKMGNNMILRFYNILKKYVLTQNLLYNINVKQSRYVILENIYPDGLTEDRFYLAVRKVFNAAVFCSVTLNEILARGGALKSNVKDLSDTDFTSGETMFA